MKYTELQHKSKEEHKEIARTGLRELCNSGVVEDVLRLGELQRAIDSIDFTQPVVGEHATGQFHEIRRTFKLTTVETIDVLRRVLERFEINRGDPGLHWRNKGLGEWIPLIIEELRDEEEREKAFRQRHQTLSTDEPVFDVWGSDEEAFSKLHDGLKGAGLIDVDRKHFRRSFREEVRTEWKGTLAQLIYLLFLLERFGNLAADYDVRKWNIAAKIFSHGKGNGLDRRLARGCLEFDNKGKPVDRNEFRSDRERRFKAIDEIIAHLK